MQFFEIDWRTRQPFDRGEFMATMPAPPPPMGESVVVRGPVNPRGGQTSWTEIYFHSGRLTMCK